MSMMAVAALAMVAAAPFRAVEGLATLLLRLYVAGASKTELASGLRAGGTAVG